MFDKKEGKSEEVTSLFYDRLAKQNKLLALYNNKQRIKIGTALLFESVGKSKIYIGSFPLLKSNDEKLGKYIVMDLGFNNYVFIDNPNSNDWFPSRNGKLIKLLNVMKYSDDDYRIIRNLDETFYRKELVQKEEVEVIDVEEDGEINTITRKIPVYDEFGNPVYETLEVPYEFPSGVTDKGRDAIRKGNEYEERMRAKRAENKGFWDKYGQQIIFVMVVGIMMVGMVFVTKLGYDHQKDMMSDFQAEMEKSRTNWGLDAEKIATIVTEKQKADAAIEENGGVPPK